MHHLESMCDRFYLSAYQYMLSIWCHGSVSFTLVLPLWERESLNKENKSQSGLACRKRNGGGSGGQAFEMLNLGADGSVPPILQKERIWSGIIIRLKNLPSMCPSKKKLGLNLGAVHFWFLDLCRIQLQMRNLKRTVFLPPLPLWEVIKHIFWLISVGERNFPSHFMSVINSLRLNHYFQNHRIKL